MILCAWNPQGLKKAIASLPAWSTRQLLLEVTDINQVAALNDRNLKIDALVAKGHESGGWVGEDSAFLLTQKLIGTQSLPVYVQGGIGIHTAAACRAAGAAGVILDDQLWLMPESPLPTEWQRYLNNLNGQEAIAIGERLEGNCRVLSRPGFEVIKTLQQLAQELELKLDAAAAKAIQCWQQQAQSLMGWGEPGTLAWPMGQAVGLSQLYRDRYKTIGKFVQALLAASVEHIKIVQAQPPLQANAPLAISHKTQYPIVQGPMRFGIPPKSLKSIEPLQLLTLEAVRRALSDAGLADGNFDRENTSVILGAGGGIADLGQQYATRSEIIRFVDNPSKEIWERLPEWTEESFPGLLLNVIAGRVANRLDLGGTNFTVDAACASSLAAIDLAVKELETAHGVTSKQ